MDPYSETKAALHPDRLLALRRREQPYPVHVQLIIADYCNQDCGFCAYRTSGYSSNQLFYVLTSDGTQNHNPRRFIPWVKLREIVKDCQQMGVRAIQLTGGGEPTVHPDFDRLCELILESNIDLALVTNGLLLKERRARLLTRAVWLRVSVDCGNAETYAGIRRVPAAEFEIIARNICRLTGIAGRRVHVGIGFVVTHENYREIEQACQTFKNWGADNVRISAVFQNAADHYYEGIKQEIEQRCQNAKALEDSQFRIHDNFNCRYQDLEHGPPSYSQCGYMHLTTYIGGDQQVYTCCVNAYNRRGQIGSIKDQSFKSLWDSFAKRTFFDQFDAKNCPRCMFNQKNRVIDQLLATPTGHDNFV